jgi:DNA modification methylase
MTLTRGDAVAIPLADESVDLIVTSPPYFALRSYQDGGEHYDGQIGSEESPQAFLEALWAVTAECARVLKPSGSIWVNLGDKYAGSGGHNNAGLVGKAVAPPPGVVVGPTGHGARRRSAPDSYNKTSIGGARPKSLMGLPWRYAIGCVDQLGLILRAEVVWSKPNGLPESVTDRVRRSHEQWFHFAKEPRYFAAMDEVREAHAEKSLTHRGGGQAHGNARNPDNNFGSDKARVIDPLGKLPGSVWTIPSEPLTVPDHLGVDHFAAFPQEWPRRIILGWSPSGYCVECGQPRVPCVEKDAPEPTAVYQEQARKRSPMNGGVGKVTLGASADEWHRTITGYACACPTPDAPTRPAVVLDPFGGTGTVAMVARALGRYPVHMDLSADYLRLAQWRIYESGHASKTTERTNRERQGVLL